MDANAQPDVIVVGGAVAGSAVANAFGSRGVRTLVIEKVSREVHSTRGDLLHPPTLAILDQWGVLNGLHADGALPITELAVSHATRGLVARFPIRPATEGADGRTISVPHDRIEAVLAARAASWDDVSTAQGVVTALVYDQAGRVTGVNYRRPGGQTESQLGARLVVLCDGAQSSLRQELGIDARAQAYDHEQIIISGEGPTELPAALHWYLDGIGRLCVVSRPHGGFRILLTLKLGERGDLLRQPDPALHDYVVGRFPALAPLNFRKAGAHLYRLSRHVASRFWAPGVALVGDSAHATHPAGATGMNLAISGALRLADCLAEPLLQQAASEIIDDALAAYDAERRPAAATAVAANHLQAVRLWESDLFQDPDAYARAVDPNASWGAGGAGWGADPAALAHEPASHPPHQEREG